MSGDERQTRQLTAAETAASLDTMVHEFKEELSRILQENEELKSKCSYLELRLTKQPKPNIQAVDSEHGTTCDKGVQCDLCCNEQGFRNSLQGNMEQKKAHQRRGGYQIQQFPLNIHGEEPLIKDEILEPGLVHTRVPNDVPDSVTPLEKGQEDDHNKLTAGNMFLCHFERVEESELDSPPEEGQSQKISQEVFRVDESMANKNNVTVQTSSNREVKSEHLQLSDELSASMKGESCDSGIGLKEIGVDVQTESSAQTNERRGPLIIRGKGKVPYPHVNLAIRNGLSIISTATSSRSPPPQKASLSELQIQPEAETGPVLRLPGGRPRSFVQQLPLQGTMSPPLTSDNCTAKKASERPSKPVELDQHGRVPCLAASFPIGYFSGDAELSGLHQAYKEMEENVVPSAAEGLEPPLSEVPKSKSTGTRKPSHNPQRQEALLQVEAINHQTPTLDAFEKSSSQPKMAVPAQTQNMAGFTSSNTPLTPSLFISSVSLQTKAKDWASYPSALVCQMSNSLPTLDQSTKIHSVPQLPSGTGNSDVSASTPSAVVPSKTWSKSSTKLKHAVIISQSNNASGATCTRAQSSLQNSFTSISKVEASCDRLGVSNTKDVPETKFAFTPTIMQGKSSNLTDIEENAACSNTENISFASERPCFVSCGPKSFPTTLPKVQHSTVASTQTASSAIRESCSDSKTLPVSSPSSSSSNKASTKRHTVKASKQVAKEKTKAAPIPLNNDPVHPLPEITKTQFFVQLSMAPVVPCQQKESLNDSVDCVVAETETHNTKRRLRKGFVKRLKGAGPSHGAETTSIPTEDVLIVEHLETDEYRSDKAGELAQKPDAGSPRCNANKPSPCGLEGLRSVTNKLSSSTKMRRFNPEKPRPEESVGLVNNAFTLRTIKTEAVWIPPVLEGSKPELGNDSPCDRLPTKWSTRYATRKRLTSPRLVTRKHRPPFTQSGSSSNNSPSAPRTGRYSHRGSTHPTPAETSPLPSTSQPFSFNRESLLRTQCEQCGRVLSSKAALQKHAGLHSGKKLFSCSLCSQVFPDPRALTRHGRVHRNGKTYICPQCNEGFAYRFGLTQHLQTVHSRIKPFVCHICQKSYFWRRDFESHFRVHTGTARQFPCNLCDKRFNRSLGLEVHLRSHSREKRHWCPYCGKEFLDYSNLKRHKYTHTGERPYACAHCTKSFVQSGHLKKHLRNVHKVDVYADLQ
ncbi:unnamed protein product [Arctogadus glacialis]